MIFPPLTDFALAELGGTGGGPETLALLIRDQDTRRLLLLRAVLDAAESADRGICPPAARDRLREDWALLAETEALTSPPGAPWHSPVRTALGHPLLGPWARRCLQGLAPGGTGGDLGAGRGEVAQPGADGVPPAPTRAAPAARLPAGYAGSAGAAGYAGSAAAAGYAGSAAAAGYAGPAGAAGYAGSAAAAGHAGSAGAGGYAGSAGAGGYAGSAGAAGYAGSAAAAGYAGPAGAGGYAGSAGAGGYVGSAGVADSVGSVVADAVPGSFGVGSVGEWERCRRELAEDLAYFSAVVAAVAARAGVPFALRLTAHGGQLVLPAIGALHLDGTQPVPVDVVHRQGRLTLRRPGAVDVVVRLEGDFGAWSDSRAWTPAYALPALLPGGTPLPLDDLDPYRAAHGDPQCYGLTGPATLDDAERKHWLQAWSGTAAALRLGGEQRLTETVTLLRCLVPLALPDGTSAEERTRGSCSATRREAFGAVLSSTPPDAARLAATLVHELHHAKLAVVSDMVPLHHADDRARHFAPWRPDPRPYDGLLQGAYAHLALADFYQRRALDGTDRAHLDTDWGQFARLHAQVGAALPALVGSDELTPPGRRFVEVMVAAHERMADSPAPRAHRVRAREYVRTARRLWAQRV